MYLVWSWDASNEGASNWSAKICCNKRAVLYKYCWILLVWTTPNNFFFVVALDALHHSARSFLRKVNFKGLPKMVFLDGTVGWRPGSTNWDKTHWKSNQFWHILTLTQSVRPFCDRSSWFWTGHKRGANFCEPLGPWCIIHFRSQKDKGG